MAAPGVDVEDLYNLLLVSDPVVTGDGAPVYVLTRLEREAYWSSLYRVERGRSVLLAGGLEASFYCPKPGPEGLLAVVYSRGARGERRQGVALVDPDTGAVTRVWEAPRGWRVLGLEWFRPGVLAVAVLEAPGDWKPYEERDYLDVGRLPFWADGYGWVFDRSVSVYLVRAPQGRAVRASPEGVDSYPFTVTGDGWLVYAAHRYELRPEEADIVAFNPDTGERRVLARRMVVTGLAGKEGFDVLAVRGHYNERGEATHERVYTIETGRGKITCHTCELDLNAANTVNSDARGPSCSRPLQWLGDDLFFPIHSAGRVSVHRLTAGGTVEPAIEAGDSVVDEYYVSRKTTLYTMMTSVSPKELYSSSGGRLTWWNRWLEGRGLSKPVHRIAGRGETALDYWVLLPPGAGECERCTPWVLYIHGGPKTSFGHGFMFEFHAIASRGIAVVYGNPRGSDGYSEEFADIRGRYGTVDYEDLMAIARDAERRFHQLSDKKRAVAGGSYGGWMTNYIITRTTMFAAAVTMRSCSNWTSFYGTSDIGWYFAKDQIGHAPWEEPGEYERASPLFSADRIRTPTLIIHSTADYRCPVEQALQLYTALRVNGVKTRLALFPGESHGLMRSGTPRRRTARLRLVLDWLEQHLKPEKAG